MHTPFTYFLLHKPTGKKYYGARWSKECHPNDLWKTYFTSSKYVEQLITEFGKESFSFEIRKTFSTVKECRKWEERVLKKLNVTSKENWLNKNINGKFLPYGKQTEKHIRTRIESIKKNPNAFMGMLNKNHSDETKKKMSLSSKGVSKTDSHKSKMPYNILNKTTIKCPHCDKTGQYVNMKRWHFDRCKYQSQSER
jgi:hypothetical protein